MNIDDMKLVLENMGKKARRASAALAVLPPEAKVDCLNNMADMLIARSAEIGSANAKDIANAKANGMDDATPEDCLEKLNSAPVDITSEDGYSFVIIHAWSGYTMDDICDMISKLDDHVKVVTPDEFMQQIMRNVKHD